MSILKGVKDEITIPLTAELAGDNLKTTKVKFRATYKKLPVSEAKAVMERARSGDLSDEEIISEYLIKWRDMPGEDGSEVEFSTDVLAQAMEIDGYRKALVEGFMAVQFGREALRTKN